MDAQIINLIKMAAATNEIDVGTDLIAEGIMDSMAMLRLISMIEDTYSLQFDFENFSPENFASVIKIEEMIRNMQKGSANGNK